MRIQLPGVLTVVSVLAGSVLTGSGCNHITTRVPGVLDMRSDGALAAVDREHKPLERSGFDAIMNGDGVTGGTEVKIVDRKYWILDLIPVVNESATEEIHGALGSSGALRNVRIGEQYTFLNFAVGACCVWVPVLGCILSPGQLGSPRDFHLWGTRILPTPEGVPPPAAAPATTMEPLTPETSPESSAPPAASY